MGTASGAGFGRLPLFERAWPFWSSRTTPVPPRSELRKSFLIAAEATADAHCSYARSPLFRSAAETWPGQSDLSGLYPRLEVLAESK